MRIFKLVVVFDDENDRGKIEKQVKGGANASGTFEGFHVIAFHFGSRIETIEAWDNVNEYTGYLGHVGCAWGAKEVEQ